MLKRENEALKPQHIVFGMKNEQKLGSKSANLDDVYSKAMPFFNFSNHAKIVGTENIVYIGSANFSNESKNNIESGIII